MCSPNSLDKGGDWSETSSVDSREPLTETAGMASPPIQLQPNIRAGIGLSQLSAEFWLLVVVAGIGAGLGGAGLMLLLRATEHAAWHYASGTFLSAVEKASLAHRWLVVVGAGVFVAVGRKLLRRSTGGHSGELSAVIWLEGARMPFWPSIARAVFSIVTVALGSALGREGAPKQVGAAIAAQLGAWRKLSPAHLRVLVASGAGAGMAAVYNVPLGGAAFESEILLGGISLPVVLPAILASLTATCVSWIALPNQSTYHVPAHAISLSLMLGALVIGLLAGLAAVIYIRMIAWADVLKPSGWPAWFAPVAVFMALAAGASLFPGLLGNGKDVVQLAFLNQISFPVLCALLFLRPLASVLCLGVGSPGGLFTPTFTVGALLGGLIGQLAGYSAHGIDVGAWAILGASAFLGASSKGPVSALILSVELIGHFEGLIIPLMLAISLAVLVCHFFEKRSIYTARIHEQASRAAAGPERPLL